MYKQLLMSALILMNVMNIVAMQEAQIEVKSKVPSLRKLIIKDLIDSKQTHPCDHMDKLLSREDIENISEDLQDDMKKAFCKKYRGYGFNEGIKSRKICNDHVRKAFMKDDGKSFYILCPTDIKELDAQSGEVVRTLDEGKFDKAFAYHNGVLIAADEYYGMIKLWNSGADHYSMRIDSKLNSPDTIRALAMENSNTFASASFDYVKIWDIKSGVCLREAHIADDKHFGNRFIMQNGNVYAISGDDVIVWDLRSDKQAPLFKSKSISTILGTSQCPYTFFAGSTTCKIEKWDARKTDNAIQIIKTNRSVNDMTVCGNNLYAAFAASFGFGGGQEERERVENHPGIGMFEIQPEGDLKQVKTLPGEGYIFDIQAYNSGLCVSGTKGLTFLTAESSYDNTYNAMKNVNFEPSEYYEITEKEGGCTIS